MLHIMRPRCCTFFGADYARVGFELTTPALPLLSTELTVWRDPGSNPVLAWNLFVQWLSPLSVVVLQCDWNTTARHYNTELNALGHIRLTSWLVLGHVSTNLSCMDLQSVTTCTQCRPLNAYVFMTHPWHSTSQFYSVGNKTHNKRKKYIKKQ